MKCLLVQAHRHYAAALALPIRNRAPVFLTDVNPTDVTVEPRLMLSIRREGLRCSNQVPSAVFVALARPRYG